MIYRVIFLTLSLCAVLLAAPGDESPDTRVSESRNRTSETAIYADIVLGHGSIYIEKAPADMIFEGEFVFKNNRPEIHYEIIGEDGRLSINFDNGRTQQKGREPRWRNLSSLKSLYENECRLKLSSELPIVINLDLGVTKGHLDLGGLKLREIRVCSGVSDEMNIDFDEPNPVLLEYFDVETGVGALDVYNLGNANLKRFNFEGGIGSYLLDFAGPYFPDTKATIELGLGKISLYLPTSAGVRMKVDKSLLSSFEIDETYKKNDFYHNNLWGKTPQSLDLNIESRVGKVSVVWIED